MKPISYITSNRGLRNSVKDILFKKRQRMNKLLVLEGSAIVTVNPENSNSTLGLKSNLHNKNSSMCDSYLEETGQ